MRKQIVQLSNLVTAIEAKMISISNIEVKTKSSTDITATDQVTPEEFTESIQFLDEAVLFRNGIDFFYEFTGNNNIRIEAGMKNKYLNEYFYVDCVIQDGFSGDDVDAKFRECVFDRLAEKIAVQVSGEWRRQWWSEGVLASPLIIRLDGYTILNVTLKDLIHPIMSGAYKEKTYIDFVSREEFINRTGIFVQPEYFDYIYDIEFKGSGVSADDFINDYEERYSTCIEEIPLHGTFKYEVMDECINCAGEYDECYEPNIWEIINSLARNSRAEFERRYDVIDKYQNLPDKMLLLTKVVRQLSLHKDIIYGLLGYLVNNKICAEEIVENQFLKDLWDISFNQIKMIGEDVKKNMDLLNQLMNGGKEE